MLCISDTIHNLRKLGLYNSDNSFRVLNYLTFHSIQYRSHSPFFCHWKHQFLDEKINWNIVYYVMNKNFKILFVYLQIEMNLDELKMDLIKVFDCYPCFDEKRSERSFNAQKSQHVEGVFWGEGRRVRTFKRDCITDLAYRPRVGCYFFYF